MSENVSVCYKRVTACYGSACKHGEQQGQTMYIYSAISNRVKVMIASELHLTNFPSLQPYKQLKLLPE